MGLEPPTPVLKDDREPKPLDHDAFTIRVKGILWASLQEKSSGNPPFVPIFSGVMRRRAYLFSGVSIGFLFYFISFYSGGTRLGSLTYL